jgi:phosphoribosyl-AMP cyclohydrolase
MRAQWDGLTFDQQGLVPAVVQEGASGAVLLLGYMNAEALATTLASGELHLWSRSRARLWCKGEQSGHRVLVDEVRLNCEGNSLLVLTRLAGPGACHDGYRSCFYRRLSAEGPPLVIADRAFDPATVYGAAEPPIPPDARAAAAADTVPDGRALERVLRALYAGYERLRDVDLAATSATSRRLRQRPFDPTEPLRRAHQELIELRGVLAGTHRHAGGEQDVVLEASQVGYWVAVAAVGARLPYVAWVPHTALLAGWSAPHDGAPPSAASIEAGNPAAPLAERLRAILAQVGMLCRQAGVHPARVVAHDLAALRARHG